MTFQSILFLIGVWTLFSILFDDDGPSDGGPRRKRKLAPIRVRIEKSR
jgi:hypothetical protein